MEYKYAPNINYEDFACGRVIYHRSGKATFPVRLSHEIFCRCLNYIERKEDSPTITLYDPCCGGAYTLTVLGYLFPDIIKSIYASDIDAQTLKLAGDNLSLLTSSGLDNRRNQLNEIYNKYHKESHQQALESVNKFQNIIDDRKTSPLLECFKLDILDKYAVKELLFKPDIIFADVPYGNLVEWSSNNQYNINEMLNSLRHLADIETIIAISFDKSQKINYNEGFKRLERFKVGKRKIEILRLS